VPGESFVPAAVVPPVEEVEELVLVEALVLAVCVGVDVEDDVVAGVLAVELVVGELDPPQPPAASASRTIADSPIACILCCFADAAASVNLISPPDLV
jgi:hypothetical protein